AAGIQKFAFYRALLAIASDAMLQFSDDPDINDGDIDLAVKRAAEGVLEINNGSAGTLRDLKARNLFFASTGEADASLGNSQGSIHILSNTMLQIRVKGSDGTVRAVNIPLAEIPE